MVSRSKRIEIKLDDVDALNNLTEKEIDERLQLYSEGSTMSFTMEESEEYIHKIAGWWEESFYLNSVEAREGLME